MHNRKINELFVCIVLLPPLNFGRFGKAIGGATLTTILFYAKRLVFLVELNLILTNFRE